MTQDDLVVTTPTTRYSVLVGPDMLATLPHHLDTLGLGGTLWMISDSEVFPRYGPDLAFHLRTAGYRVESYVIPSGEGSKSQDELWKLYTWMISKGVERRDTVLALGGGVVGDLSGFAAATILRGIALVQLPTTLLAMVDAAIGGKTGINHALGKNLVGAFHQPRLVLADTYTLRSLAPRELRAGWAEVIKHGVIRDAALFGLLETHARDIGTAHTLHQASPDSEQLLGRIIRQAAAVKVTVVSVDEREGGERIILNYGHTLAHALEAITHYGELLHGEAVAIGMHAAARIAQALGLLAAAEVERQQRLLSAYGLPTAFPAHVDGERLLALTLHDKKVQNQRVRWVLPVGIGTVTVRHDVPEEVVRSVINVL